MAYKNAVGQHHKETGGRGIVGDILNVYYGNRMFLLLCCVCSEAFYLLLYLEEVGGMKEVEWVRWMRRAVGWGWGVKQITNVAQIVEAARKIDMVKGGGEGGTS